MSVWKPTIAMGEGADALFLRIARAIASDIQRGRLARGSPVPGSRTLAASLGVHRNTVVAAYRELVAEGWLTTDAARGTFVSSALPEVTPRRFAPAPRRTTPGCIGFDVPEGPRPYEVAPDPPGALALRGGVPDVRLAPSAALARAYRRALRTHRLAALAYGDPRGHRRLRAALAEMLAATRGLATREDDLLIVRGSQMAIDLAARTLLRPGDVVAVEALGYRPAWEAFAAAGARVVPVPLDAGGVRLDALGELVARERVRAVYLTPHHQYPTTVALAAGRRLALLALARDRRFAVLEDDYDHEFHYDGRPILPLASADAAGVVVYVGTLSKVLAPGLRLGYVVAPRLLLERMTARRVFVDRQGDHALEHALSEMLEEGEVSRHVRRARKIYHARRDALTAALRGALGDAVAFTPPAGGTAMWVKAAEGIDVEAWGARARAAGVSLQTAQTFAFDGAPRPFLRLGFAQLDEAEIAEAVRRLARALPPRSRARMRQRAAV